MSEEVKVNIRSEADNRGLDDTQAKIKSLRAEMAKLEAERDRHMQRATTVEESGGGRAVRDKIAALRAEAQREEKMGLGDMAKRTRSTADKLEKRNDAGVASEAAEHRAAAAAIDKDIGGKRKEIAAAEKQEQKAARDEKAKHLREQRAEDRAAAADERAVKREMHQEEMKRQRFGRAVIGGVGVGAATWGINEAFTEFTERRGIALRDQAARTMNARALAVGASWRATSGQVQSDQFATEQRMDEREANRAETDRAADSKMWKHGLSGAAGGAATGAAIGSIVPLIGTAIGGIVGGIVGGVGGLIHGGAEGSRTKAERDLAQQRDAKLQQDQKNLARKKFVEEDGGIEMDLARHRAERTQSGQRAAFVDEQKKQWHARYVAMRGLAGNDVEASQTANLEMETRMRDRQIAAGSGLVDARSGAGDIAAAAAWGGMSTPGMTELRAEMAAFHQTVKSNSATMEALSRPRMSIEAQDQRK